MRNPEVFQVEPISPALIVRIEPEELGAYLGLVTALGLVPQTRWLGQWFKDATIQTVDNNICLCISLHEKCCETCRRAADFLRDCVTDFAAARGAEYPTWVTVGNRIVEALERAAAYCPEATPAVTAEE